MFGNGALAGSAALTVKYKGKLPAVLRTTHGSDAGPDQSMVRHDLYGMPVTRETEVSDAELEDVVAYLTREPEEVRRAVADDGTIVAPYGSIGAEFM